MLNLEELQQACEVCFWRIDLEENAVFTAGEWEELLGLALEYRPRSLSQWLALVHPVDRAELEAALQGPKLSRPLTAEARLKHADGHWRWIRFKARLVEPGLRWIGIAEEVTLNKSLALRSEERRRAAEDALRESEELYRGLYKRTTEHLFLVAIGSDGNLRYAGLNPAHQSATGLEEKALRGKTPHECLPVHIADHVLANYRRCFETGKLVIYEEELELPRGRINWLTQLVPLQDKAGKVSRLLGICTDLTRLKNQEQALRLAQRRESVGKIAAGIAHDFNNLLTVIICQLGLLEYEVSDNHELGSQIEAISQAAQRAAELTKGLLNLGGQQLGKQVPIRLSQIFDRLRSILASLVGPSISLVYQLESAGSISAQPIHLDQIVLNLVGNAAEAIGSRGGEIRLRVGEQRLGDQAPVLFPLTPLPAGDYMTLEVIDNGPGVDSAFVGGLFESGMSSKGEGRGLGLATVKSLVLELGGGLSVLSTPGQGTRFKLFFPICVSPEVLETLSLDLEEESGLALPLTGHIVLCSEDNHFRRSMGMTLQHLGLSHEEATHAGELLTLLAKCPDKFDLMVLDVTHKEQQDQVLGGLAAIAPRAKTLIMSDLPAGELLLGHAYPAPNAYLQKPFRLSELARRLGKLLQS